MESQFLARSAGLGETGVSSLRGYGVCREGREIRAAQVLRLLRSPELVLLRIFFLEGKAKLLFFFRFYFLSHLYTQL